jgi:hypothetical protein
LPIPAVHPFTITAPTTPGINKANVLPAYVLACTRRRNKGERTSIKITRLKKSTPSKRKNDRNNNTSH